jgi:hypothetical protein
MQHDRKGRSGIQEAKWQTSMLRNLSAAQCMIAVTCRGLQHIYQDVLAAIPPLPLQNLIQLSNGKALATDVLFTTMSNVNAARKLHSDAGLLEGNPGKQETRMHIKQKLITNVRFLHTILGVARKENAKKLPKDPQGANRRHPSGTDSVSQRWSRQETEHQRKQEHHQNNDSFGGRCPPSS